MTARRLSDRAWAPVRRLLAVGSCVVLTATGCAFHGLNSLPLPGAEGRPFLIFLGPGANIYHVDVANVVTLESNSPVMIDDVVVGSISNMSVKDWHADLEISVKRDVVVPANAVASIGQTSLLGSMHLELNPPLDQPATGRLKSCLGGRQTPDCTIGLNRSSTYPSTEQTLASVSAVVNGGGLGQIGEIIHNFNAALSGHQGAIRDLITRLDTFVGTLDQQRDNLVGSIQELNRFAGTLAGQRDAITQALRKVPPALDVLIRERPRLTTALDRLRVFSNTATGLINDTEADLVRNLKNLEPTIKALADVGPEISAALGYALTFPFTQNLIDRGARGDFFNLWAQLDLTIPRLKRGLMLGTHWGELAAPEPPAPGDPYYLNYTLDPLGAGAGRAPLPGPPPSQAPAATVAPAAGPLPGPPPSQGAPPSASPPAEGGG